MGLAFSRVTHCSECGRSLSNNEYGICNSCEEKEKPVLPYGTIVYCKGHNGAGSFYGIVYENGVLELECGSSAYINTREYLHIGDTINYWTIESVCKAKMIIKDIIKED